MNKKISLTIVLLFILIIQIVLIAMHSLLKTEGFNRKKILTEQEAKEEYIQQQEENTEEEKNSTDELNGNNQVKYPIVRKLAYTRRYIMITPDDIETKGKLPLLVYLHGSGEQNWEYFYERISGLEIVKCISSGYAYESGEFIFVAPNMNYEYEKAHNVLGFINFIINEYKDNIDTNRIVLTGHSTKGDTV